MQAKTFRSARDRRVIHAVHSFLDELCPSLEKHARGSTGTFPIWTPSVDDIEPAYEEHIKALRIPALDGNPDLLLHDLGCFGKDDKNLARIQNLFSSEKHTCFVNATGTGKTRLLLEGLCQNWGFYFTARRTSGFGSNDIERAMEFHSRKPARTSSPYKTPQRTFKEIFLARLIIFHLYLEIVKKIATRRPADRPVKQLKLNSFHKRWLLLQLRPSFEDPNVHLGDDIFGRLSQLLSEASTMFIVTKTGDLLKSVLGLSLDIEGLSSSSRLPTTASYKTPLQLFCVLDDAQYATRHLSCVAGSAASSSLLRDALSSWDQGIKSLASKSQVNIVIILSGTRISKGDLFPPSLSTQKSDNYRWYHDTGSFSRKAGQAEQTKYLKKYIPTCFWDSAPGERLDFRARIWYWLRGRYRFTASFVSNLLANGFRHPQLLLTRYILHLANFEVTDTSRHVDQEGVDSNLRVIPLHGICFEARFELQASKISAIHNSLATFLTRGSRTNTLDRDATYVEHGFLPVSESGQLKERKVVIREPLIVLAAARFTSIKYEPFHETLERRICSGGIPNGAAFENYLAICIDKLFSVDRRLDEIFDFGRSPPSWASRNAVLVGLRRTNRHCEGAILQCRSRQFQFSGPSVTLGVNARRPEDTLKWLEHRSCSPICFPNKYMGPDLFFVLRLDDNSLIWVALQAKYRSLQVLPKRDVEEARRSVTPSFFFRHKHGNLHGHPNYTRRPNIFGDTAERLLSLPFRRSDAGKYSLLRVIASFPAKTRLENAGPDEDQDGHPIACLNMDLVQEINCDPSFQCATPNVVEPHRASTRTISKKRRFSVLSEDAEAKSVSKGHRKKFKSIIKL
ncbi:hypothetical protein CVT26_008436 [Gymnopilus dilepis]|uniref:Uncharacterized protein n=1 Tax=Gymnopilus dilepis TaxID=231916 RepID=A0A409XXG0_9AGAR|nr:hypothetical protein CVT26_008436 [Gymnopilus dilepis]